ncbi:MAG: GlsB/YeaQ/YmgE family stress response membrane protein [Betaproteobacteria bacterium]|nr:MAG: GlsB/YeaQ/YmgE family stress response membrane protein [Betaproteobacteria bacterium]
MNIALWILAGGAVGWAGFTYLGFNEGRGQKIAIIIGAAGAILGGKLLAPMFGAVAADFSVMALIVALASAAACLAIANKVHDRFGV